MRTKAKPLSTAIQAWALRRYFPVGNVEYRHPILIWEGLLKPTVISPEYLVRVVYVIGKAPKTYVLKPQLQLDNKGKLPHVYSVSEQQLCLYYPQNRDWHNNKLIATTILPWASEWLYYYEIWCTTGKWRGGGTGNHDNVNIEYDFM